jgi:hypothetical protein
MTKKRKAVNLKELQKLINAAEFVPTPDMVKFKQKLLAKLEDNPAFSILNISPEVAFEVTRDKRLQAWVTIPGFAEWLGNKSEYKERLGGLIDMAMEKAEEILTSKSERAMGAQVTLIKIMLEAGGKFPKAAKEDNRMDKLQALSDDKLFDTLKSLGWTPPVGLLEPTKQQERGEYEDLPE